MISNEKDDSLMEEEYGLYDDGEVLESDADLELLEESKGGAAKRAITTTESCARKDCKLETRRRLDAYLARILHEQVD